MSKVKDNLKVAAGHHHVHHRLAPTIALEKGYFAEEGLEKVRIFASGKDEGTVAGLQDGSIDIGLDLQPSKIMIANYRGQKLYVVGGWLNHMPLFLMAERDIKSVDDLRGKRIGLLEPDGIFERQFRKLLTGANIDPDREVNWVYRCGNPRLQVRSLREGRCQTALVHQGDVQPLLDEGYSLVKDLREIYPNGYPARVLGSNEEMLADYPDTLFAFFKGLIRAYRFVKDQRNFGEVNAIHEALREKELDMGRGEAEIGLSYRGPEDTGGVLWLENAVPPSDGLQMVLEEEQDAGRIGREFRLEQVLRIETVQRAAEEIDGRYGKGNYC